MGEGKRPKARCVAWPALLLLGLLATTDAAAQSQAAGPDTFDCVIEPKSLIRLGSRVAGVLDEVMVDRGDIVKRGQTVARIENSLEVVEAEIARKRANEQVELESRKARLAFDQEKARRLEGLYKRKVVSAEARDEARTNAQISALAVREAEAKLRTRALELKRAEEMVRRRNILSPVDGVVHQRLLSPGEYAHEQSPVMVIAQVDPLNVEVYLPIDKYGEVAIGTVGEVEPIEPIGGRYEAKVSVVDRVFDAASGTFGVRLELPNPSHRLPAGIRCQVTFPHR